MIFNYNKDYKLRDSMLNCKFGDDIDKDYDIFWFDGLDAIGLQRLVDLRFADVEEYQNSSPTIGEILEFLKKNPSFTAHGYAVTPLRDDYRISIEGVEGKTDNRDEIDNFIKLFRHADDFRFESGYAYAWFD